MTVLADQVLEKRLKRLMLLRVVMITTLLLVAVGVEAVSEHLLPVNPLYFLIVMTYVFTLLHVMALRLIRQKVAQVYAQVIGDLLIVTGLVYVTGGTRAGFMLLYPISVLSGSVLLYRGGGLTLAGLATFFYTGLLFSVRLGWIAPGGVEDVLTLPLKTLSFSIFVVGVACGTVALIGSYLSESLRSAGQQLEEAEEEVADLRELNDVIVSSIHSGLVTIDAGGRILHVNRFGEMILGRSGAELRGRPVREVFGSWLLDLPAVQARSADQTLARLEVTYQRPDHGTLELGLSVSPLDTNDPARSGHLIVFQDLTEIKRLEQEVRIKEKLAAVGEMAAHLAHEIRNPLGSISGSAQVLLAERNLSAEQEHLLAIITKESRRLSGTLNQFLFQARSSPGAQGPLDLRPVISEAVALLRNAPEVGPSHSVEFSADQGPHVCLADRDQITQVFWNLARNGLEAMPGGGVLNVRLRRDGDDLVLNVRDQGRGMGHEERRRMFEPFHSQTQMGTGLGLAIVYRIVRDHRGDISVRSVPQMGTEVEVRLPHIPVPVPA